jgi:hypothetical protein
MAKVTSNLGDIPVMVAPMLAGMNKGVYAYGKLYVPPEVYDLMADETTSLELILKHLPCVMLPQAHPLTRLAIMCLHMKGGDK